ncbi:MAG: hypothetical protein LBM59_00450 [Ruminococcus sp.]|jgi:hypothetical protein|nr:hypothetical protein [Ruminococcus sp.]
MIHDIPKPNISEKFTNEDIHKIREWNYERFKDATIDERNEYCNKSLPEWALKRMVKLSDRKRDNYMV